MKQLKLNKRFIRENLMYAEPPVFVADDGYSEIVFNQKSVEDNIGDVYRRSLFELSIRNLVTHRVQETDAVKDNVSASIFMELYGWIIADLHRILHKAHYGTREENIDELRRLLEVFERD